MKQIWLLILTVVMVLVPSGVVQAQGMGTVFTYQGRLSDGGSPANGKYDFEFKAFNAVESGSQSGGTVTKEDVLVYDGYFTVSLDFLGVVFTGEKRWLDIGVRPWEESGDFTQLSPRQEVTASPYSLYAKTAGSVTGGTGVHGVGTANYIPKFTGSETIGNSAIYESGGNVGLGTTNPNYKLHVEANAPDYPVIYGYNTDTLTPSSGVIGVSDSVTGKGVSGYGETGIGVYGYGETGVYGQGWTAGMIGQTYGTGKAVWGYNPDNGGWAGYFDGRFMVKGTDNFDAAGEEATIYLGDENHYIKGIYSGGIKIGTWSVGDAVTIKEPSGYVGIGTTTPVQMLHVYGASNPRILVEAPAAASPEFNLKRGTQAWALWMDSDNDLNFFQNGNKVTFTAAGNVGIGTSAPAEKLEVAGTVKAVNNSGTSVYGESFNGTAVYGYTYGGNAIYGRDGSGSGLGYAGYFDGNVYVTGSISAQTVTDRTPYPPNLATAYQAIQSMQRLPQGRYQPKNIEQQLDHSKLSDFIRSKNGGRDLSATVSCQNEVLKDLIKKVETQQKLIDQQKTQIQQLIRLVAQKVQ